MSGIFLGSGLTGKRGGRQVRRAGTHPGKIEQPLDHRFVGAFGLHGFVELHAQHDGPLAVVEQLLVLHVPEVKGTLALNENRQRGLGAGGTGRRALASGLASSWAFKCATSASSSATISS